MIATVRPLDRFRLVHAPSTDKMCAALARVYAQPKEQFETGVKSVDARLNLDQGKNVSFSYTG